LIDGRRRRNIRDVLPRRADLAENEEAVRRARARMHRCVDGTKAVITLYCAADAMAGSVTCSLAAARPPPGGSDGIPGGES
jgi:hypothetical protein